MQYRSIHPISTYTTSANPTQPNSPSMASMALVQFPLFLNASKSTSISPNTLSPSTKPTRFQISSRQESFLDLTPTYKSEFLNIDLRRHDASCRKEYGMVVIGGGPAGLRLAERVSLHGVDVCCIDPSPLSGWPNNYGSWVDEFESMGLEDCLDKTWPMTYVIIDEQRRKYLDRPYGRVGRKVLKAKLMESCLSQGVRFHEAKAWKVVHEEFSSTVQCSDGCDVKASLVVDASGFSSTLLDYDARHGQQQRGYQIAHGILAEVEGHPFDLDKMLLMDWRDSHMGNEPYLRPANNKLPTFLYAMPLSHNLIFLEETSLVSRPVLSYAEIKKRMVARLRNLGIKVKQVLEDEKCLIPMGGPLPIIPQSVVGAGGTAGLVHPSTGYLVARALATASVMADLIVECLGSIRMVRGRQLHGRVWSSLWPLERKLEREFYCFGMETLLKLDLQGTRSFFDAFFDLDPYYWHGFLSSRLSIGELAMLSLSLFGHASNPSKLDIVSKCPIPLVKMMGKLALASI